MNFKRMTWMGGRVAAAAMAAGLVSTLGGCVDDGGYGRSYGPVYGPAYGPAYGGVVEYGPSYRDRRPVFEPEYDRRRAPVARQDFHGEPRRESRPREEHRAPAAPSRQESRPSPGIRGPIERNTNRAPHERDTDHGR